VAPGSKGQPAAHHQCFSGIIKIIIIIKNNNN
jgi:hypothetical protein